MTERLLHHFLTAELPGVRVCSELPADLADVLPVVQAVGISGTSDDGTRHFRQAIVSVDSFAGSRVAATDLADDVDDVLRRLLPGATVLGTVVTKVRTISLPSWRPWDDTTAVRRFGATYQLWLHAQPAG